MSLLDIALEYGKLGWFVLPIDPVKKQPLIKWADRKHKRPEPEEIRRWFEIWPDARVGVVTGSPSGVDVVDLDGSEAYARFEALYGMPETIMQATGRKEGGLHLFFKHNHNGLRCSAGKDENKGIDLRTDGGIVVVAPSQHPSGECYQWLNVNPAEDGLDDLLEMPPGVIEHFKKQGGNYKGRKPITLDPVERGARNDTLTRLVGKWISQGMDHETVYLAAAGWNHKLNEPLDDKEVKTIVESVFRTHERNHPEEQVKAPEDKEAPRMELFDFPHQVLAGAAGYFADVYNDSIESCPQFLFMSYLTCLGNVLCPKLSVKTSLKTQPRLYVVLVGESADDRKSTSIDASVDFFNSVSRFYFDRSKNDTFNQEASRRQGIQEIFKRQETNPQRGNAGSLL